MRVEFELDDLRPPIETVVVETVARLEADQAKLGKRLAFGETEAAALLGVRPHVLGDARRRGEIVGSRVGKRVVYTHDQLLAFLRRNQTE